MANWLDTTFYTFDKAILGFWGRLAESAGDFLTPVMKFISLFGAKGLFMIFLSVALMLFKSTRKHGLTAIIAVIIGAIVTNLILKNVVARARPYTRGEFKGWWQLVGSPTESDYSFPSGHATVAVDCFLAIFLVSKKKSISWLWLVFAFLICLSRNYLMVHYPTDVIAGVIVGAVAATLSTLLVTFSYKKINLNQTNKFCYFLLNACITDLFRKKVVKEEPNKTENDKKEETEREK